MAVREKFEQELAHLKVKIIELANLASESISKSFTALENQDLDMALEIIEDDTKADLLEEEINDYAILLIAKQQPVAIDLRRIIAAIKIASDIERMADFGVNIAKSTIRIGQQPFINSLSHLRDMKDVTIEMIQLSIQAFEDEDIAMARKIADMDDEVDRLYGENLKSLLTQSHENLQQVTQLTFIARFLERTADHTTNIAESIYYLVKGRHFDLND
ncbi:phosphate signaling complex protein PhoU [Peribacillus cavernae]|uniref:Phosphate-specific transport system accessory protein PhoU n=1 Tax=Peribacillus cavernae TaxID=1674310 RepID=A0A3S0U044_9BACI|nr:phosphate signaling complex protein PhoU [Peribacillus cavernae]MDQ0218305.1 phosphate transport system protein [Peribacillus cavernae]RUQ28413.1 phosphate signaling complex protein PhoU [Peribacillus cavernae]